jgi:hypothetical protein
LCFFDDKPGRDASYRVADGRVFRKVNGPLAYVLDSGQLGDPRDVAL